MITKEQAIALGDRTLREEIHCTAVRQCSKTVGPRGGVTTQIVKVRPNGVCKTWTTRPFDFALPYKYGLYEHGYITRERAHEFHLASDCPLNTVSQKPSVGKDTNDNG